MRFVTITAAIALIAAVSYPLATRQIALQRQAAAAEWLDAIADAQTRFRSAHGGYAARLASLVEPCSGQPPLLSATLMTPAASTFPSTANAEPVIADHGHEIAMRPARDAVEGPLDCHGRATVSDYYVSARPIHVDRYAMRALAMISERRVFVFVDGVPPTEEDMAGGLAEER